MAIAEALIPEFSHEAKTTRRLLEVVPEERFDWQPHEKSMTLGRLAGHIAEMPKWAHLTVRQDVLDFEDGGDYQPFNPATSEELLAGHDEAVEVFHRSLAGVDDQRMLATWTMRKGEEVLAEMPRVAAVRGFILSHIVHHRGQLSVYLRLLDVALPQTYGPTADNPSF